MTKKQEYIETAARLKSSVNDMCKSANTFSVAAGYEMKMMLSLFDLLDARMTELEDKVSAIDLANKE